MLNQVAACQHLLDEAPVAHAGAGSERPHASAMTAYLNAGFQPANLYNKSACRNALVKKVEFVGWVFLKKCTLTLARANM